MLQTPNSYMVEVSMIHKINLISLDLLYHTRIRGSHLLQNLVLHTLHQTWLLRQKTKMYNKWIISLLCMTVPGLAYQPSRLQPQQQPQPHPQQSSSIFFSSSSTKSTTNLPVTTESFLFHQHTQKAKAATAKIAATAALTIILASTGGLPAFASSSSAAQIQLDQFPPSTISVQIQDLPVVGNLLSGTYMKVPDDSFKGKPSITVKSPTDKVAAVSSIISTGHLEFDVGGKLVTHLDVDLAADEPGIAKIRVASNLIPKLPFRNLASSQGSPTGGRESQWNVVTNLGNGESYYYNSKTGVTQLERPSKI